MKVVLFCGGQGMRLRESFPSIPKPMVPIGGRPILWNLMKYYAHFGHKDFVLCLGHKAHVVKNYFLPDSQHTMSEAGFIDGEKSFNPPEPHDWCIEFSEAGLHANIGMRLRAAEVFLSDLAPDDIFLANYADALTDAPLDQILEFFKASGKIACFVCIKPKQSLHYVSLDESSLVQSIQSANDTELLINGGFFLFKKRVFEFIREGEELVEEPFARLIEAQELLAYPYNGFWKSMDTYKDRIGFDKMYANGNCPWALWSTREGAS